MGLLKKLTKPLSKFLDKVVPNEIKPALPFLSAAMPFMMGPAGIGASPSFWNTMMGRAIMMGGANLGSQLSQEGSEGDFNPMSLAMASGIGALSAPGNPGTAIGSPQMGSVGYQPSAAEFLKTKAGGMDPGWIKGGTEMLGKGADFIRASQGTLTDPGFNMATLKAASVPVAQGMGDLAFADAQRALRDFENTPTEDPGGVTDDGRRMAIRAAMEAAGHIEDDILDAIASLGLKEGGRVGKAGGGIMHAKRGFVDGPGGYAGLEEIEDMREFRIANQGIEDVADYKGYYERLKNPQNYDEQGFEIKENVEEVDFGGVKEAVGNIAEENELVASRQSDFFMLREEAIMKNDFDKIKEIEFDFFKEFGIKMPVAQNISEEAPVQMAADGGMMSVLPKGREMDYRGGGVIPMGSKERADDVPARLSKNEFVMTADAVKAAGGGSVNKGAKRMYNLMHKLEARV